MPRWYADAKLGVFVHWGVYSVPAWGTPREPGQHTPVELEFAHHAYAEWYANTVRIPGSPTRRFHERTYDLGTSYEDLADRWTAERFDPDAWMELFAACGARYVVPTAKHHDGFCLWDSATTPFTAARRGPRRDLLADLSGAARRHGLRLGLYYSGALDWHVGDFPPIRSLTDLFELRRNDREFADFAHDQLTELVDRFRPDYLWNDIDWPDSGKGRGDKDLAALFARYLDQVPEGLVNDRWGVPYFGVPTREYVSEQRTTDRVWEACRGLGRSFGHNTAEDDRHLVSGPELIHLLLDTVAKNGNLLINVGPRADGSLPEDQVERLRQLGDWLTVNSSAIHGSRPWRRHRDPVGRPVRYTTRDGDLYVADLAPARGALVPSADVAELAAGCTAHWLAPGGRRPAKPGPDGTFDVPEELRSTAAAVLVIEGGAA
ncbi:alpha-L-fucosidase [Streptomyces cavernicola]|uniref:alpha-L-fucosidase n=1 Tax=Streptomyces cavernicola TaxID=3043613 RepID=A0ABT6S7X5_9ACTN|nr:alpha-L-fucosidase [Streptomyces sp. B-S-A6]MDI3404207.1 alpha-L-fucosidase [Streptomyces sp. B-S-A6]